MAPLPESSTARAFLSYSVNGDNHTMMVRIDPSMTNDEVSASISAFLTAMAPTVNASLFVKFERSVEGSNVRVPATWTGLTEWGTNGFDTTKTPRFWSFTGKDVSGRRFRLELFGRAGADNDNYRIFAADDTAIEAAIDALETEEPAFLTIGNSSPIYNQYANQSYSQHWIGVSRS